MILFTLKKDSMDILNVILTCRPIFLSGINLCAGKTFLILSTLFIVWYAIDYHAESIYNLKLILFNFDHKIHRVGIILGHVDLKEAFGGKDVKAASLEDSGSDDSEEKEGEAEKEQKKKKKAGFRDRRVSINCCSLGYPCSSFSLN